MTTNAEKIHAARTKALTLKPNSMIRLTADTTSHWLFFFGDRYYIGSFDGHGETKIAPFFKNRPTLALEVSGVTAIVQRLEATPYTMFA